MSLFYRMAYALGFTPWEQAAQQEAQHISALFDREERERQRPYRRALDLGCGTGPLSVELAKRGWQVTGVDNVPRAIRKARERARQANVDVRFLEGDVTALRDAQVGSDFRFFLDIGCFHGLSGAEREAMGREVTSVSAPDATLLLLAWKPGGRGPLPRGASRGDIETCFAQWTLVDEEAVDSTALPRPLQGVDPRCYRLRRGGSPAAAVGDGR